MCKEGLKAQVPRTCVLAIQADVVADKVSGKYMEIVHLDAHLTGAS